MTSTARALIGAAVITTALWMLHAAGIGFGLLLASAIAIGGIALLAPRLGLRALEALNERRRIVQWGDQQGRHHAFGGVSLRIEDDGRQVWIAGDDLKLVLRSADSDAVLAARHADHALATRRDPKGMLWIRVDAVVQRLASAPGRMDPRVVRLRRYFERDVLFPASERRRRGI